TIGHVHSGALGWVAMISIGAIYMLIPKCLGRTEMASLRLVDTHFWMHTIGVLLYAVSMWISGIGQGLMSRATNPDGTLTYAWIEIVKFTYPYYLIRLLGGVLVLVGMVVMIVNVVRTVRESRGVVEAPVLAPAHA
ncbi:MAG: cbb3-type cytochrome c oxidase subunit I, partial [Lysobacteraceae bacterium]